MATTYTTIQGDTWDMIAYRLFGDESQMKELVEANLQHIDTMIFRSGTVLSVPELRESRNGSVPFWRKDDLTDNNAVAASIQTGGKIDG